MEAGQIRHLGVVKNGIFKPYKPALLKQELQGKEGKAMYVLFEDYQPEKTKDELGYYYGGIIAGTCLQTEMFGGWEKAEIDNFFQTMFLDETITKTIRDEIVSFNKRNRISGLTKKQMSHFINQVIRWLAEEGIEVLPSDMYLKSKYRAIKANG
jgi:hypothetical protein